MKKYKATLIIIVIIAAALLGSYFLVNFIRSLREPAAVTTGTADVLRVVDFREEDLSRITVTNSSGTYVFDRDEELDSTFHWRMVEPTQFEAYPFYAYNRCSAVLSVTAADTVQDASENGVIYGFDRPGATVRYGKADGTDVTLIIGSPTPTGSGYYGTADGGATVYILPSGLLDDVELFNKDNLASDYVFVNRKDRIQEVAFSRDGSLVWHIRRDTAGEKLWNMLAPVSSGAVTATIEDRLLIDLVNLQYKAILSEDAEDLSAYGLDKPDYEITVTEYGGKAVVLRLAEAGPTYENFFFGCCKGGSQVFLISKSDLGFLDSGAYEYVNTVAYYPELRELSGMDFTVDGRSISADVTTSETVYVFIVNGTEAPDRDALIKLYTSTVWLEADEVGVGATDAAPYVTWTYRFTDGTSTRMELRDIGTEGNEFMLYQDGTMTGLMFYRTKITPVVEAFEAAEASIVR